MRDATDSGLRELLSGLDDVLDRYANEGYESTMKAFGTFAADVMHQRNMLRTRLQSILTAAGDSQPTAPAGMDPPIDQQRDMLAQAIRDAAVKAGIARADASMTGPMLLMLCDDLANAAVPAAQVAYPSEDHGCVYENGDGICRECADLAATNKAAAPAVVVDEGSQSWMTDELIESAPRAKELAGRLVAPGPKAASVSASETHEIADFIFDTVAALAAALKGVAVQYVQVGEVFADKSVHEEGDFAIGWTIEDPDDFPPGTPVYALSNTCEPGSGK